MSSPPLKRQAYVQKLEEELQNVKKDSQLFQKIVDLPFLDKRYSTSIDLGIVVLLLVNKKRGTIDRIALSDTDMAKGAVDISVKPFREIKIPIEYDRNFIVRTIKEGTPHKTTDWQYMFIPALKPEEARLNQAAAGIGCSFIYPLKNARDGGALIFSYYISLDKITPRHHEFMKTYSTLASKALRI